MHCELLTSTNFALHVDFNLLNQLQIVIEGTELPLKLHTFLFTSYKNDIILKLLPSMIFILNAFYVSLLFNPSYDS